MLFFFLTFLYEGKEIPFDRDTLIPAGNVAYGLAWTYVLNYLAFVLQGTKSQLFNFNYMNITSSDKYI